LLTALVLAAEDVLLVWVAPVVVRVVREGVVSQENTLAPQRLQRLGTVREASGVTGGKLLCDDLDSIIHGLSVVVNPIHREVPQPRVQSGGTAENLPSLHEGHRGVGAVLHQGNARRQSRVDTQDIAVGPTHSCPLIMSATTYSRHAVHASIASS